MSPKKNFSENEFLYLQLDNTHHHINHQTTHSQTEKKCTCLFHELVFFLHMILIQAKVG
ncbi:MAG: hypothetical protein RL422_1199 [Bacteroidota bacterium]